VLLVEQNARAALKIADRGYVLETGKIILQGPAEDLMANRDVQLPTWAGKKSNSRSRSATEHGETMYWESEKECMAGCLEQLQLERLQSTLYRVGTHVPFTGKNSSSSGSTTTTPFPGRSTPPALHHQTGSARQLSYGLFAVPLRDVVRIHSSSGHGSGDSGRLYRNTSRTGQTWWPEF